MSGRRRRSAPSKRPAARSGAHRTADCTPEDNPSKHPGAFLADYYGFTDPDYGDHIAHHDPAWVLRDIAAKRAALKRHARCGSGIGWCDDGGHGIPPEFGGCFDLREIALVDEAHADFSPLWKHEDWED
jgi:uncharacterized protein DUF6221